MPRPAHFEIHADDIERASSFYSRVFGWKVQQAMEDYWFLLTATSEDEPGIDGAIMPREGGQPADGAAVSSYVVTMSVPNVDEYASRVTAAGGTIVVPKEAVPQVGWVAYAKDTEGNIFGMFQDDSNAA